MDEWFIKMYRSILKWEWYDDMPTKVLFLHLLLTVNYTDWRWHWIEVKKWSRITSLSKLSKESGLTLQQVRTAISKLKSTQEITQFQHTDYTFIQVNNWDIYQWQSTQSSTQKQHDSNTEVTTIEESNKERREEYNSKDDMYTQAWHLSITHDEFTKLEKEFGMEKADELVQSVLNYRKNSKYKSLYLTAQKWGRAEKKKEDIPIKTVVRTVNYNQL